MSDDDERAEPFGASYLAEWRSRRLEEAKSSYNQILNRLWASNGAGAAATLTAVGVIMKDGHSSPGLFLLPLSLFLIGLMLLGAGDAITLIVEAWVIHDMESVQSVLDLKVDHAKRPSEQAGLTFSNLQTRMAVGAAVALVLGVIAGFGILLCSSAASVR